MTINMAGINTGLLVPDVADAIILNQLADRYPLYSLLVARGALEQTDAETFSWATNANAVRRNQINSGALNAASTTLTLDSTAPYYPDCLVLSEATNELMHVVSISSATQMVVIRGVGGTTAADASVADNVWLRNIGPANGENAPVPAARTDAESLVSNTVQTIRTAVEISGRADRVRTFAGRREDEQIAMKLEEHLQSLEHGIIFGGRSTGYTANARRVTLSSGIRRVITTNVDAIGGSMTRARFFQFARLACQRKRDGMIGLCGATALEAIHNIYGGNLRVTTGERAVGLRITEAVTPHGTLTILPHPMLNDGYAGDIIAVDPDVLKLRYTQGARSGRPNLIRDVQAAGQDGKVHEWFSEMGLEYGGEFQHALATGITGAA